MSRRNVESRVPDTRGLNFYDIDDSLHRRAVEDPGSFPD